MPLVGDKVLISIIVPVYNKEFYIGDCISSLVTQSYSNIEIVLINDGSTDQSGKICKEWAQRDQRIIVLSTNNNGVSAARNAGLDIAKGKYIVFVDADDTLSKKVVDCLVKGIQQSKADIWISGFEEKLFEECQKNFSRYLLRKRKVAVWGCIYKASLAKKVRFFESLVNNEDFVYLYYLSRLTNNVSGCRDSLYQYRDVPGSLSKSKNDSKIKSSLLSLNIIRNNLPLGLRQDFLLYQFYIYAYVLLQLDYTTIMNHDWKEIDIKKLSHYIGMNYVMWFRSERNKSLKKVVEYLALALCPKLTIRIVSIIKKGR